MALLQFARERVAELLRRLQIAQRFSHGQGVLLGLLAQRFIQRRLIRSQLPDGVMGFRQVALQLSAAGGLAQVIRTNADAERQQIGKEMGLQVTKHQSEG
ncbi:hypothetical protein I5Q14_23850 [Serratia marcescens]|nr:hypothetical protein [Serratia marcescens]